MVYVLPEPVTPRRVWYWLPASIDVESCSMAVGWSPEGLYGLDTVKFGKVTPWIFNLIPKLSLGISYVYYIIFGIITQQNIMEKEMSALQRLQEKIEQWKRDHENLKSQNNDLKSQLAGVASAQKEKELLMVELESKNSLCMTQKETIETLNRELAEKDTEIEKIIAQVETLLG